MIDLKGDLTYTQGPDDLMFHSIPNLTTLVATRRSRLVEFRDLKAPKSIIKREERMVSAAEIALKTKVGKLPPIPEFLEGWPAGAFTDIPHGQFGSSRKVPFVVAPNNWNSDGIPFGAWCLCKTCNLVGRLTDAFDFFADGPGSLLKCEACTALKLSKIRR
jgi:hypothetical protein